MIKLTADKMTNAIARAKQVRPRVLWQGGRTYHVTSSDRRRVYKVTFAVSNGQKLGECTCKAGEAGQVCFHIAAATSVNIAVQSIRRQAEQAAAARSRKLPDELNEFTNLLPVPAPTHTRSAEAAAAPFVPRTLTGETYCGVAI